ncbi:MAG: TonB-dependent receptor [Thermoanaerobaculia bacterium]
MTFPRRSVFMIGLALVLIAASAFAQTGATFATLMGTITTDGKPLPGVTVTIASPALQGTRTTVTGEGGGYTFGALPPGVYTVNMALEGMQPVTRKVTLAVNSQSRVDGEMKVGSVTEAITVTANAPAVLETTQVGSNFKQEVINSLPVARNIRQTVLLTPGVNPNGVNRQITISGAPTYENTFMVNGVVVNENLRGQPHDLFIEDAIQETTVLTGGISAEYGRFTGGVVSTLTKSGGNDFSGSFRDSLTNAAWTATPDFPGTPDPVSKTNQVYEATLGGRIIRDHLWFFGAGRQAKTVTPTFTIKTNIPISQGVDEKRYEGKMTGQIGSRNNLVLSYLDVKHTDTNNIFPDIYDDASIVPSRQLPNKLESVDYNSIWTNSFLTEVQWAKKQFSFINSGGRFTDRIHGTWVQDSVSAGRAFAPVFCGVCGPEKRDSDQIGGKATYFLSTRMFGNHNLVFGGDRFSETRVSNNYQSGSNYTILARVAQVPGDPTSVVPVFNSSTRLTWRPIFVLTPGTDLKSNAVYANDRWDFNNHFSFNVGLRYDKNKAADADRNVVSDDSTFSPRLGMNWDVRGDGKHRVTASAARYAAKVTDGSNVTSTAQAAGSPAAFTFAYKGPNVNSIDGNGFATGTIVSPDDAFNTLFKWYDSIGGDSSTDFISSTYPGYGSRFPKSLKSPAADEFTAGYGMQLGRNAYVKLDGVHREWHNFYAAEITDPNQKITPPNKVVSDLLFTVNDDQFTKRKYNAIELQGQWSPSTAFYAGGNYTWSTLKGNDVPEGAGTATIRNRPSQIYYPEYLSYAQYRPMGYLNQDRRHRARGWGGYNFNTPIGRINVSALESFDSGFAYSALGQIDATGRSSTFVFHDIPKNPGYTLSALGTSHDYFFSKRGAFRTDSRFETDLSVNYALPLMGSKFEMFFRGDLLNAFNTQKIIDSSLINADVITSLTGQATKVDANGAYVSGSGLFPFNPIKDTPVECPKGASGSTCFGMHANYQLGPNFGKAASAAALQVDDRSLAPRTYRFSVGLRF